MGIDEILFQIIYQHLKKRISSGIEKHLKKSTRTASSTQCLHQINVSLVVAFSSGASFTEVYYFLIKLLLNVTFAFLNIYCRNYYLWFFRKAIETHYLRFLIFWRKRLDHGRYTSSIYNILLKNKNKKQQLQLAHEKVGFIKENWIKYVHSKWKMHILVITSVQCVHIVKIIGFEIITNNY